MKTILLILISLSLFLSLSACQASLLNSLDLSQSSGSGSQNQRVSNRFVLDLGQPAPADTSERASTDQEEHAD